MTGDRVLFLASDLGATGAARRLALLAPRLAAHGFAPVVVVLGKADTPAAAALRAAGVAVHAAPLRPPLDVTGWRHLRAVVAAAGPRVIHAWGPAAVRVGSVLSRWGGPPLVAAAAGDAEGGVKGWLTARALRRAERVIAASWAEAERYRRLGVCGDHLTRIAPGVEAAPPPPDRAAFLKEIGLPPGARFVATAGTIEPSASLKAAVWAFDMLRYTFTDLHLVVFGAGPDRAGLEAFGRALAFDDLRVHFPGPRADLSVVLGLAEAVWVLQARGGVSLALEAMAAGRPVVAWNNPDVAEAVEDGETAELVGVGEKAQVAAKTHTLLADPGAAARLGASGKARAAGRFAADRMAAPHARVYHELPRR
ncbi:glycosyltransferase family 4 protein [bacterium]|nr:glycosyltransferase family 4 protein [bacterium]